jgi:hypothetical protein
VVAVLAVDYLGLTSLEVLEGVLAVFYKVQ